MNECQYSIFGLTLQQHLKKSDYEMIKKALYISVIQFNLIVVYVCPLFNSMLKHTLSYSVFGGKSM